MKEFKELLKKSIVRLFLVVWTPFGEEKKSDIDVSFGFVFKDDPNKLCVISVNKDELWLPYISYESLPLNKFTWDDFYYRIKMWMKADDDNLTIGKEYYDVTNCDLFKNIVSSVIEELELLYVKDISEPFGLKILFENDYIISMPNTDGNTVETRYFNRNDNVENFKQLGNVIYSKV